LLSRDKEIKNKLGLHARAAAQLVQTANRFASEFFIKSGKTRVNGKSIMGVLMLAAVKGTTLTLEVAGTDEAGMMESLCALFDNKFGEE